MRAWTYHVPVPPEHQRVEYCDVRVDHGAFDYEALLSHWENAARKYGAEPVIDRGWEGVDVASPMYERVRAMYDYVYWSDFSRPIAFLDSDAFLNAGIAHVFDGDWDIGVTYRHNMAMPLNEGCILVNNRNRVNVVDFFAAYLATYDSLIDDPDIKAKYGNIKRWRGGQLSLNAIANPRGIPTSLDRIECHGATVAYFPCFKWNYPVDHVDHRLWDTKAVLHLKGSRKSLLPQIIEYQEGR